MAKSAYWREGVGRVGGGAGGEGVVEGLELRQEGAAEGEAVEDEVVQDEVEAGVPGGDADEGGPEERRAVEVDGGEGLGAGEAEGLGFAFRGMEGGRGR